MQSKKQPPSALLFPFRQGGHDSARASYLSFASSRYSQNPETVATTAPPALRDCNFSPMRMVTPGRTITSCVPEILDISSEDYYAHNTDCHTDRHRSEYGHVDIEKDVRLPSPTLHIGADRCAVAGSRASRGNHDRNPSALDFKSAQTHHRRSSSSSSSSPAPLIEKARLQYSAQQIPRAKRKLSLLVMLLASIAALLVTEEIVFGALWTQILARQETGQNAFLAGYFDCKMPNAVGAAVGGGLMLGLQAIMHNQLIESRAAMLLWSFIVVFVTYLGCGVAYGVVHR